MPCADERQKIVLPDASFTHVATNIGFHVVPDSEAALNGMEL
jgi:ubiquinone/menaquinone biosynthesis C-methylase UbiE